MGEHACHLCRIGLENVSVVRGGQTLLQDVSMHIHCGQLTVLIGQNGAGKTTLVRALLGELPHGGVIRHIDGQDRDIPQASSRMVFFSQSILDHRAPKASLRRNPKPPAIMTAG